MTTAKPRFITFEGVECSGKGIQTKLLFSRLTTKLINIILTREPGGTPNGEFFRAAIKNPEIALPAVFAALADHSDYPNMATLSEATQRGELDFGRSGITETLEFLTARSTWAPYVQHLLSEGHTVLSDRGPDSTVAYQGGGHQQDIDLMIKLNQYALGGLSPNLTLYLDIPIDVMFERMSHESSEKNSYIEQHYGRNFFERVRTAYLEIAKREPDRFKVIDGTASIEEVAASVNGHVDALLAA